MSGESLQPAQRLYIKRISGGRIKFTFDGPYLGGSYLILEPYLKDMLAGRRSEVYAPFVPDSPEWRERRRGFSGEKDGGPSPEGGSGAKPRDKDGQAQDGSGPDDASYKED
ncbi:MAG TPA: hypothetical protein VMS77_08855 [Conexivisphaerales archaeon]|nr:hypothetical protein [Conexivisphaerales archaeon]